jgi:Protein of unknown function (DUF1573)
MIRKWLSFRTLSIALAVILAFTAALKLHMLLTDPFADIKTGTSLPLLWLAVFAEISVACIVLSNTTEMLKWLSLFSLFGALLVFSVLSVMKGRSTCGCAGVFNFYPLTVSIFDCVCLIFLWINSTVRNKSIGYMLKSISANPLQFAGQTCCCVVGACILFVIYPALDRSGFFSRLRDEQILIRRVDFGAHAWSSFVKVQIELKNLSDSQINIVGAKSSCSCVSIEKLPVSIPGKSSLVTTVVVQPQKTGPFHQRIEFYTDSRRQFVAGADIFGHFREGL